jgi:hypothetical protein
VTNHLQSLLPSNAQHPQIAYPEVVAGGECF